MFIKVDRKMFGKKQFDKGLLKNGKDFVYWVNFWGLGVLVSNNKLK